MSGRTYNRAPMASLILGPLLRYVGRTQATIWIETDGPCTVTAPGRSTPTFEVEGHHYALVVLDDLPEGEVIEYEVELDGERVWPPADDEHPPSVIRTREGEHQARLVFGSCRVGAPQREPYTLPPDEDDEGFGVDALWAYSRRLQAGIEPWPDGLLLIGDQVYADEVSPETLEFIRGRRDVSQPPGEEVADFEEYTRLYREAWTDPDIRWLLSTVPSVMVFDDHDVIDDWNISWEWVEDARSQWWWDGRITGAFMSYWIYQHLGNLAPPELGEEELYRAGRGRRGHRRGAAGGSRGRPTATRRRRGGRASATSAARGCWWSTRVRPACSRTAAATWSTTASGSGSACTAAGTSTTWSSSARCRCSCRPACTTWRRGARRCARARGAARPPGSARSCGGRSTSSTGRRSSGRSSG